MARVTEKIDSFFIHRLWKTGAGSLTGSTPRRVRLLRLVYVIARGMSEEQLILRATSLVYTALLSFVPLLAVSFSVLKSFGVHTRFLIILYYFLEPLGESGIDLSMKIIGFVENVSISVLGSIGLLSLIYTVISTVQKTESALNYIWNIRGTRGLSQRFSNYMSVLLVGPVLIFAAIGITTSFMSSAVVRKLLTIQLLGPAVYMTSRVVPYLLIAFAFALIYMLLPNTRVKVGAALGGGISAALLWQTIGWIFAAFIASSAQYSAIYSGFATLILSLIWLYWNFLTLLVGARVSYYLQHPQLLEAGTGRMRLSERLKERLALAIMFLVGRSFLNNEPHWRFAALAQKLAVPSEFVGEALAVLEDRGLLTATRSDPPAYLPARAPETITLHEIISAVRSSGEENQGGSGAAVSMAPVDGVIKDMEEAIACSLESRTLKDLLLPEKR